MNERLRLSAAAIEDIVERAEEIGVEIDASLTPDGDIWLGHICRRNGHPGAGQQALEMLCELADEANCTIGLAVISFLDRVIEIYEEAGFEEADESLYGRQPDDGFIIMMRKPL